MKRLWPLPVFLLLALPLRAQRRDEPAAEPAAAEELAPPEGDAPNGEDSTGDAARGSSDVQGGAIPNGGGDRLMGEKPEKEKPFISITAAPEGGDLEPAQPVKMAVADATLIRGPKKTKGQKAVKGGKAAKIKNAPSPVVTAKAPVVIAPPPVPVSAVPITPITPRNP